MIEHILSLSKKLISVQSTKDNPQGLQEVLEICKSELTGFTIEEFESHGVKSILVYKGKIGQRKFKFVLDAHLDVVPGRSDQFQSLEKEGRLYARGAIDMKAAAAVELLVFKDLANKIPYPLALQLVTDEEIGGFDGAKYQVDRGVRADFTIAGEGTNLGVKNKAKGIVWANIKTKGKAAHGAYLWQGKNAIWKMFHALSRLEKKFPEPLKEVWKTTINVAKINSTNATYNKVAEDCAVGIDVRFIPEDDKTIVEKIKRLLPKDVEIEIFVKEPAQFTAETNTYIKKLRRAEKTVIGTFAPMIVKHGGSDIRHFNRVGCAGVEFGPIGYGLHTDDEWVDIKSLESYYKILREFLKA